MSALPFPLVIKELSVTKTDAMSTPRALACEATSSGDGDAIAARLRTFRLRNYIGPIASIRAHVDDCGARWELRIEVTLMVPPRDAIEIDPQTGRRLHFNDVVDVRFGKSATIEKSPAEPWDFFGTPEGAALEELRSTIHEAIEHELDECMLVDGDRRWDPHAEPKGVH